MLELNTQVSLSLGQRSALPAPSLLVLQQGRAELYAEDLATGKQLFLAELTELKPLYLVPYEKINYSLFALEACSLSFEDTARLEPERLEALTIEAKAILGCSLPQRFELLQEAKEQRIDRLVAQEQRLIDESINNLLQREAVPRQDKDAKEQERISYVVRCVAKALDMPQDNISLKPELAANLDQLGLMKRLVQKGNMTMRLVRLSDTWYKSDSGALIGYYGEEKEMVALVPVTESSYKMYSYATPEGVPVDEQVMAKLDKDAFQCYTGFPSRKLKVKDLFYFMYKQCWKRDYQTIIICSLVAGLIPLVSPIITETIFSDIIPIRDHISLAAVTQIMLITGFTTAALSLVRAIAFMRITNHIDMSVEAALWGRLLRLPASFFRRFESGELLQRMNAIEAIKAVATGQFVGQVFGFLFSFWSVGLMLWYSWKLTFIALAIWFIYFIIIGIVYRRLLNYQKEMVAASNKTASLLQQIFTGLTKFRVHGAEAQAFNLWSKAFGEEWKWKMALRWQNNYNAIIGAAQPFILNMLLYYTVVYGMQDTTATGQMVRSISYPQFLAFQAAFAAFNGTVVGVIPLVAQFFSLKPHIDNLRPILEEEPELNDDKVDAELLTGAIRIEHLSFSYGEDLPEVLSDINLEIKPGENVAIVGKSGCGKSTLLRLLLGMEIPKRGAIYYDSQDMQDVNLASLRCQLGVVLQNGQLMAGDIFTNIVGTMPLSMDDAWAAAELAGIARDIEDMPMGMHTVISEGSSNISGGQRQRLLIARAIVAKPAIVLLDEATSALDNRSQAIVMESLNRMKATRIMVAHRLSTIKEADRIILIEGGKIAEQGSFEELMALDGIFAGLAKRQMV